MERAGIELWRIHRRTHAPVWFSRDTSHRFNAPRGQYGVCYLFDRAANVLAPEGTAVPLDDLGRIRPILLRYTIRVI